VQRATLFLAVAGGLSAAPRAYELRGQIVPEAPAAISLFGATTPFHAETVADQRGSFRFRELCPASTLSPSSFGAAARSAKR